MVRDFILWEGFLIKKVTLFKQTSREVAGQRTESEMDA